MSDSLTLDEFLTLRGVDVSKTYLHIIRDGGAPHRSDTDVLKQPNATRDWLLSRSAPNPEQALFDITLADTAHNDATVWTKDRDGRFLDIAVLIDTGVAASELDHVEGAYLLLGVIQVLGRREGVKESESGEFPGAPGWELEWRWKFGEYLFVHPRLSRGWKFHAAGEATTTARHFRLVGSVKVSVTRPIEKQLRGWQLTHAEMAERIKMANWKTFLSTPGVYLIQVYDPDRRAFFQYVGKATKRISDRWATYAETKGTAGGRDAIGLATGNKYLAQLCDEMGEAKFLAGWRIQVLRVADSDEINDVEREMKEALCTFHMDSDGPERYRSAFGLNGN